MNDFITIALLTASILLSIRYLMITNEKNREEQNKLNGLSE